MAVSEVEMKSFSINRRRFLETSASAFALSTLGAYGVDLVNRAPRKVGVIGTGWYGKNDIFRLMQVAPVDVVSVCDVDRNHVEEAADLISQRLDSGKRPRTYGDYRKMLDENELDIVIIGTPDHWHALQTIAALEAGAHVYVQKPTSVDVLEGEAMLQAARAQGRVVQVGTQRKSTPHIVEAKRRIIEGGLLGEVRHVEMCCYYPMRANGNPPVEPVPDFLDYEMWTGPAPLRPYDGLPHLRWWRTFMEYGNGILGDMCVHMLDTARWMLGLGWPDRIYSTGGIFVQTDGKSNIPDTQTATFEFGDLNMVWQHRSWGAPPDPDYPWACFLYGEKGTLKLDVRKFDFIPHQGRGKAESTAEPIHVDCVDETDKFPEDLKEKRIELHAAPATRAHMLDFLAAIDQQSRPVADIEEGHISSASCILANLSMELGRPLVYDPATRTIPGDAEATALLSRDYRAPWEHPHG